MAATGRRLGCFLVRLGDLNGFDAEGRCATWAETESWLDEQARTLYPDSAYASGF